MNIEDEIESRTTEEQKHANEIYAAYKNELYKRELSNTENYDRAILTLSASALGLSLTAIRFVVPLEVARYIWLLDTSWLLLTLGVILSLAAYQISNKGIEIELKHAEEYYVHAKKLALNKPNIYRKYNTIVNYLTGFIFVISICMITLFVVTNIKSGGHVMSKANGKNTTTTFVGDSANIPHMQQVQTSTGIGKNSANIPTMQQVPTTNPTSQSGGNNNSGSSK